MAVLLFSGIGKRKNRDGDMLFEESAFLKLALADAARASSFRPHFKRPPSHLQVLVCSRKDAVVRGGGGWVR